MSRKQGEEGSGEGKRYLPINIRDRGALEHQLLLLERKAQILAGI